MVLIIIAYRYNSVGLSMILRSSQSFLKTFFFRQITEIFIIVVLILISEKIKNSIGSVRFLHSLQSFLKTFFSSNRDLSRQILFPTPSIESNILQTQYLFSNSCPYNQIEQSCIYIHVYIIYVFNHIYIYM